MQEIFLMMSANWGTLTHSFKNYGIYALIHWDDEEHTYR
jgi:hypothetical protein